MADRIATTDEGGDWSLIDFAKEVFGAQNASEVGFDFVETKLAEEALPTPPAAEVPVVEQREPATAKTREEPSAISETAPPLAVAEVQEAQLPAPREKTVNKDGRQFRTATEMADIILNALRTIEGVPERGFVVTIYGTNPWNAMLTIKPEAGRIKDAQLWRERVQDIGARLRQDFDLVYEHRSIRCSCQGVIVPLNTRWRLTPKSNKGAQAPDYPQ